MYRHWWGGAGWGGGGGKVVGPGGTGLGRRQAAALYIFVSRQGALHQARCPRPRRWHRKADVFHLLLTMALVLDSRWGPARGERARRGAGRLREQHGALLSVLC